MRILIGCGLAELACFLSLIHSTNTLNARYEVGPGGALVNLKGQGSCSHGAYNPWGKVDNKSVNK